MRFRCKGSTEKMGTVTIFCSCCGCVAILINGKWKLSPFSPKLIPLRPNGCILGPFRSSHTVCVAQGCDVAFVHRGTSGSTDRLACRTSAAPEIGLARRCPERSWVTASPGFPAERGDGTVRSRGWAHPSRQRFHRLRAAGRPCRIKLQQVPRRLRRPAPGIDAKPRVLGTAGSKVVSRQS